jgi:hypothetical protein
MRNYSRNHRVGLCVNNDGQQYGVSDLPRGLYLVQVVDRSGNVITTQKINKR